MTSSPTTAKVYKPWPALWSLVIGFFMILIDTTIVSVANPSIQKSLHADIDQVLWVTSAYLLAYAVPLLITGRLGDRFGPKNLFLIGLTIFTLASLWCGLSGDIEWLIVARVVQGLGAALMTPQSMAVITRIFAPDKRGAAMGLWGATSGVAMLVGPILGGVLVDGFGWEWIFFINIPLGVLAFVLVARNVPALETHPHKFDILGVVLSAVGLFLLVFGIQEGQNYNWGQIVGPISVWGLIISGIVVLAAFVVWQALNKGEPLVPLALFKDRNFSVGNLAMASVGLIVVAMSLPLVYFYQIARGLTPTQSALMLVPLAVLTAGLSPLIGRFTNRISGKWFALVGLVLLAAALYWYSVLMTADTPILLMLLPSALMGVANSGIWGPIATITTRNLPMHQAGAGSGIYNTVRQIGAVIGSAAVAVLIQSRLAANLPGVPTGGSSFGGKLPDALIAPFSTAMSQTMYLPIAFAVLAAIVVLFFEKPKPMKGFTTPTAGTTEAEVARVAAEA